MKIKKRIAEAQDIVKSVGEPERKKHPHRKLVVASALIVSVLLVIGGLVWFYADRALPNVTVGNTEVGNQASTAVREAINKQVSSMSVTFDLNGAKKTIPAKDLGVVVDTQATLQKTLQARRSGNLWQNLMIGQNIRVPLVLVNDPNVLIDYVKKNYPDIYVNAKEPEIVYNNDASKFEVKAGETGKGLDLQAFQRALPEIALHPQGYTFKVTTAPTQPIIDQSKLPAVADGANQRIQQKIEFKLNGAVIYTAEPSDIASWIYFDADATQGTLSLKVDKAKVQQFLTDQVGPTVASPPVDRKVVVDSSSGAQTVIQQGRAGSQIKDTEELAGEVTAAVSDNKSLSKDVSIDTAPFKTVTMTGAGKWIEVDLSKQQLTMWLGNTIVMQTLISSGRAATPTQAGEFAIYSKTPMTTMTGTILGEYYYVPDIPWVSYFDQGEAFHGTYWHHNFGHPMSHGCVNMTIADAKTLYDFAPIGTKVIVHY
jgi:lipoprotein-anchoring transpeptidase ErfK/SrfK